MEEKTANSRKKSSPKDMTSVHRRKAQNAVWRHADEIEDMNDKKRKHSGRFSQEQLNNGLKRNTSGDYIPLHSNIEREKDRINPSASQRKADESSRKKSQSAKASQNRNSVKESTSNQRPVLGSAQNYHRSASSPKRNQQSFQNKKKRKRGCGCFGCFPSLLLLLILFLGAGIFGLAAFLHQQFDQIEKYTLDAEKVTVTANDSNMEDYQNIALFGVDNQDNHIGTTGSRTDCIIIASIHKKTKEVKLMSIYRDTYVSIDGEYDKINAAYSYGGPELALSTINRNLDLNIQDFATVNFKALADAVDVLGGISLTVDSDEELENLNNYIHNMNNINGGDSPAFEAPDEYPFTAVFDGNQAVAYSRIRYMAGGDHKRASHQRIVVQAIMDSVKKQPWKIKKLIDVVLPQCITSLSSKDMTLLSLNLPRYKMVDSQAYPFQSEDERYDGIYYGFALDVYSNVQQAHAYLFDCQDYTPTEELEKISEKVSRAAAEIGLQ